MSAFRIYISSLVSHQDFETNGLTLKIDESGHISCAMSHPEFGSYANAYDLVICCRLLSETRLVAFFQTDSRKYRFITLDDKVPSRPTLKIVCLCVVKIWSLPVLSLSSELKMGPLWLKMIALILKFSAICLADHGFQFEL